MGSLLLGSAASWYPAGQSVLHGRCSWLGYSLGLPVMAWFHPRSCWGVVSVGFHVVSSVFGTATFAYAGCQHGWRRGGGQGYSPGVPHSLVVGVGWHLHCFCSVCGSVGAGIHCPFMSAGHQYRQERWLAMVGVTHQGMAPFSSWELGTMSMLFPHHSWAWWPSLCKGNPPLLLPTPLFPFYLVFPIPNLLFISCFILDQVPSLIIDPNNWCLPSLD